MIVSLRFLITHCCSVRRGRYDDEFRGHDADGGQVLELSLHNVEMIVESPGHVVHDLRDF